MMLFVLDEDEFFWCSNSVLADLSTNSPSTFISRLTLGICQKSPQVEREGKGIVMFLDLLVTVDWIMPVNTCVVLSTFCLILMQTSKESTSHELFLDLITRQQAFQK